MANTHTIRQFDELPSWTYHLSFDNSTDPAQWPALNADDVVTIIARKGSESPILHRVPAEARVDAQRQVRWDFTSAQTTVAGDYKVWTRVTQADGRSYTHPLEGADTLKVEAAGASTDVVNPA